MIKGKFMAWCALVTLAFAYTTWNGDSFLGAETFGPEGKTHVDRQGRTHGGFWFFRGGGWGGGWHK
jgi:hypothetical protein